MNSPIIYIDCSKIRDGKLEHLKTALFDLKSLVEINIPRLISYSFYLNEVETELTVVAVHPDSESLDFHLDMGRKQFEKFKELVDLLSIEVYRQVDDFTLGSLRKKAQLPGNGKVIVYNFLTGFSRFLINH